MWIEPCSVGEKTYIQRVSNQVSLGRMRRMTCVKLFCFRYTIVSMSKNHYNSLFCWM